LIGTAELVAFGVLGLMLAAEFIHQLRVRRIAQLAFGPTKKPHIWSYLGVPVRIVAAGALAWGFTTLLLIDPKIHNQGEIEEYHAAQNVLLIKTTSEK